MSKLWVALLAVVLAVCHRTSAITSGSPTTIEKHPYQVAIDSVTYSEDDSSKKYQYTATMLCSGALLSKSTVITAASCIMGTSEQTPSNTKVRVGAQFREGGGETYDVASWLVNPNLDLYSGDYDLMLVFLDGEVTLRNGVQTVPLVDPAVGFNSGETLFLTGYGDLDETTRDAEGQVQLQAVALPAFNIDICLYAYNIYYSFAPKGCAGGWGAGMCGTRDIGSPIVNWRGQLVGVAIQQKNKCGVLGLPTVFTSLADADISKWIVANAKDLPV